MQQKLEEKNQPVLEALKKPNKSPHSKDIAAAGNSGN